MARGLLPLIVGLVLGALVVTVLFDQSGAVPPSASPGAAPPSALSATDGQLDTTNRIVGLDELAAIADAAERRKAAFAFVAGGGYDPAELDRVASFLSPDERIALRIHAIANLGSRDMPAALGAAVALPEHEQRRLALLRLASVLTRSNPAGAIAVIDTVQAPELATEFVGAVFTAWAELDPAGLLAHLESIDAYAPIPAAAFEKLAASEPERLLSIAENLPRGDRAAATTAALNELIERDPAGMLAYIDRLPPGPGTATLRTKATAAYAERDPEGAWAWTQERDEERALAKMTVVRGIHRADPGKAWDIMRSMWNSSDAQTRSEAREYLMSYVNIVVESEAADEIPRGLDRILSLDPDDTSIPSGMMVNLRAWASRDPEAALDWTLKNSGRIDIASVVTEAGASLARTDADLARQTVFRLDEQHRAALTRGVARTLATNDLGTAETWARSFPSGPLRDAGLREVIGAQALGGTIDRQLFDLISNDGARSDAASLAARRFACDGRTALALELATAYITDRRLLESTKQLIENLPPSSRSFECQFLQ